MLYVPPKRQFPFNGIHRATSLKIEIFKTTIVRISNPAKLLLLEKTVTNQELHSQRSQEQIKFKECLLPFSSEFFLH
jgi:hypothetical protein